jgi:hypothetical protein
MERVGDDEPAGCREASEQPVQVHTAQGRCEVHPATVRGLPHARVLLERPLLLLALQHVRAERRLRLHLPQS